VIPNSPKETIPSAWYPLCRACDLKAGQVLPVRINGVDYAVWRSASGKVSVLAAQCCHVGADLARGTVMGETLQCPLHHWCYDDRGNCVHIPATKAIPARARQDSLACDESYGLIFAFVAGVPSMELPRFEGEIEAVWSRADVVDVDAPLMTLVANSYDGQHFAAVHDRELIETPQVMCSGTDHIFIQYRAKVVGKSIGDRLMRLAGIKQVDVTIHCWGGSLVHVYNQRTASTILVALLPLDEGHTRVFILTALKQKAVGLASPLQAIYLEIARRITVSFLRQDMAVLQGVTMRPRVLLPGVDEGLMTWLRYWRALPRPAQRLNGHLRSDDIAILSLNSNQTLQHAYSIRKESEDPPEGWGEEVTQQDA
jgi:nitrite reductase/ring-hydroxylating ferredoxin subunit